MNEKGKWEEPLQEPPIIGCECYVCQFKRENITMVKMNMRLGAEVTNKQREIDKLKDELDAARVELKYTREVSMRRYDTMIRQEETIKAQEKKIADIPSGKRRVHFPSAF